MAQYQSLSDDFQLKSGQFFIEDAPNARDEFGHEAVVDALDNAVRTLPQPFAIGLVGEWGVGKSFVLRQLETRLKKHEDLRVFYFDAWKYAGESVKRSLLTTFFHQAKVSDSPEAKDWLTRLYHTRQKPLQLVVASKRELLLYRVLPAVVAFVLLILSEVIFKQEWLAALSGSVLVATTLSLLGVALQVINLANNAIQVAWETESIPPVASAEQFEIIFGEFLKNIFENSQAKRAVILIDELDRCDTNTRAEVLQGLRTYLKNDRCVYVVACAPKNITASPAEDSATAELPDEEFLRKLFQLTFWMDSQGEENLREYGEQLLTEAEFPTENRQLVEIVVLGNTRNPPRTWSGGRRLLTYSAICSNPGMRAIIMLLMMRFAHMGDN